MFVTSLFLHSLVRWLVLASLLFAIARACHGWLTHRPYSRWDRFARLCAVSFLHLQLLLGIVLYILSPVVTYFLHHFKEAVHQRDLRFFGMEHVTMMVLAVTVITIGSAKVKRRPTDAAKYKTMVIWFTIGLLMIFLSIPWAFSPFTVRPYIRPF